MERLICCGRRAETGETQAQFWNIRVAEAQRPISKLCCANVKAMVGKQWQPKIWDKGRRVITLQDLENSRLVWILWACGGGSLRSVKGCCSAFAWLRGENVEATSCHQSLPSSLLLATRLMRPSNNLTCGEVQNLLREERHWIKSV